MDRKENYIWYASYGSNLLEERFLCYIRGGKPAGSNTQHKGCRDKTLPIDNKEIHINHELYFARKSRSWGNGGVAFICTRSNPQTRTLGRMYLITTEQFIDVVKQENDFTGSLNIDFEKAVHSGSLVFKKTQWYGNLIYLGEHSGSPIFTFTHENDISPPTRPSESYLKTIIKGIRETHYQLRAEDIVNYLSSIQGIENYYSSKELMELF